jgi:hypothetical protein
MKLHRSKKGIGTVIAAIMFLLIAILFVGGTFLWQTTTEAHMNAFEKDRMDEMLTVEASYVYNDVTPPGFFETQLKVKNTGPIDIQIIQAWIIDLDHNEHQHVDCYYAIPVDGFDHIAEIEALQDSLTHEFDIENHQYVFKVVTERGNLASSRLMPRAAFLSNWPAVIVPEASWVKRSGNGGLIQLVVYNRLSDPLHLTLIVASRLEHGSEHSELIEVDMWIQGGEQEVFLEQGTEGQIYQVGEVVFIEIADSDGIVVSSYYFTCE